MHIFQRALPYQKCIYSILTKSLYKVTMITFRIRGWVDCVLTKPVQPCTKVTYSWVISRPTDSNTSWVHDITCRPTLTLIIDEAVNFLKWKWWTCHHPSNVPSFSQYTHNNRRNRIAIIRVIAHSHRIVNQTGTIHSKWNRPYSLIIGVLLSASSVAVLFTQARYHNSTV